MQIKLLNDIVSDIAGKAGSDILQLLIGKKDVNEFFVAKKLKLTINQVRNILYKLSNYNLVTFTRKKDKKKGWYTYFWTLDNEKALDLLDNKLKREIENFKNQFRSRENKRFFMCTTCKTEISEETALFHNFTCQECGEIYALADNRKIISELRNSLAKLEKNREQVLEELNKIREVKEKKRGRDSRREEKAKKKGRQEARAKKKKEIEKEERAKKKARKKVKKKIKKKGKKKKRR